MKRKKKGRDAALLGEDGEIMRELNNLQTELARAHNGLDYATDEALIDGYIYEIRSLNMKYTYCLNLCKERGVTAKTAFAN